MEEDIKILEENIMILESHINQLKEYEDEQELVEALRNLIKISREKAESEIYLYNAYQDAGKKMFEYSEENDKLKEEIKEYERIIDIWDERQYRKRYLEERRKEQPNLLYPDSDEIYANYYDLKYKVNKLEKSLCEHDEIIARLEEENTRLEIENQSYRDYMGEPPCYDNASYIKKSKIKEKIEELVKEGYWEYLEQGDLDKTKKILQELLEE